jgi:hypothetical protein
VKTKRIVTAARARVPTPAVATVTAKAEREGRHERYER